MSQEHKFATPQEEFWAGDFGTNYIGRNNSDRLLATNLQFFTRALTKAAWINSCVELGANVGMNLRALKLLYPEIDARAVEINPNAAAELGKLIGPDRVSCQSIYEWQPAQPAQLAYIKGVLIHLAPEMLSVAYDRLYAASSRYILVAEYYNPVPVAVSYRGHEGRLFKRDFAGEMLDRFSDLQLLDYGFCYRRDATMPETDDITWFLLEKRS